MESLAPLPRSFFARDADVVARDLVGRWLVSHCVEGVAAVRVVEAEAYFGHRGDTAHLAGRRDLASDVREYLVAEGDRASHAFPGETPRSRVMRGPPGHAYVYLIYGMHECFNVSTGPEGVGQAVLVRAGEPVVGVEVLAARRPRARRAVDVARGPGRLAQALGITRALNGASVTAGPPVFFAAGAPAEVVAEGPRVNVVGAEGLPLRFFDPGSGHVSRGPSATAVRSRGFR